MKEQVAKQTAKWWRNKLGRHHDNGDTSMQSIMSGIMADSLALKHAATIEQLDKFESELTKLLMKENGNRVTLNCDYHPCATLMYAAYDAGIDVSLFPWKTNSITENDKVLVSDGYAAPYVELTA